MSEQENYNLEEGAGSSLNLRDLFDVVMHNWYWFALSGLLCVATAFLYLRITPPTYTRTATVLINDEKSGGGMGDMSSFMELGMMGGGNGVENEVLVFKSKRLVQDVVELLDLNTTYSQKKNLSRIDLYKQTPLQVQALDNAEMQSFSCVLVPLADNRYALKEVTLPESHIAYAESTDFEAEFALNDTVQTPMGRLVVTATPYYLDTALGEALYVSCAPLKGVAMNYLGRVNIAPASKQASLIKLTINDTNVDRAESFLNTLIAVYNQDAIKDKNQIAENTSHFIDERLVIISQELGAVDENIETYKKEHKLTDIALETGMVLATDKEYEAEYVELQNQKNVANFIRDYLGDKSKLGDLIPSNTGVADAGIERQIALYNEQLLKLDKLSTGASDRNPILVDLNRSMVSMRRSIVRSIDNLVESLKMRETNLQEQAKAMNTRIKAVPTQEKYVLTVVRQQKIKEELYLFLLNKREENAISLAITESNARIVDPAYGSDAPIAPKKAMVLLAAMLLGLMLPAGVLYLLTLLDTKVQSRKDLEELTTIPYLGDIPAYKGKKGEVDEKDLVVKESGRDSVTEAFRILRSNMSFMMGKEMKVVMLTSAVPGSGKSFVSLNLAVSMAMSAKKVLLVDADIRKGTASKRYKELSEVLDTHPGLTNYLSDQLSDLDAILIKGVTHPMLDVITSGPVPPNPAELLMSERFDKLIDRLRPRYDYIIIDNVPATMVADAMIVNRVADMTIYVVKQGNLDKRMLPEVERLHQSGKLKNMALLLNGATYSEKGYGYGYGYGYGNGYGYGYGNEEDTKKNRSLKKKMFGKK